MRLPRVFHSVVHGLNAAPSRPSQAVTGSPAADVGTRAFAGQGTMAHPGVNSPDQVRFPQDANQFVIGGPEFGALGNQTIAHWMPNPAQWEENPAGSRDEQLRTDASLQIGAAPGRILRQMYSRIYGMDGAATGEPYGAGGSLPYQESWQYIPHVQVPRKAQGTKGPQKLADDNAPIPAIFAGNPR